jgi:N-acetylglucosamine kinase-like BadF-type ATPase
MLVSSLINAFMKMIADSGATKTAWTLLGARSKKNFQTQGLSPYYFSSQQIADTLKAELIPGLGKKEISSIFYYGTGCATAPMQKIVRDGLKMAFPGVKDIEVQSDLFGAARALCGVEKGVACILGTGSNSCVFNGKKITRNNPAPGYVLGDEGSGAYLGKKVLQHFIYETFDEELMHRFRQKFQIEYREILDNVYKKPWPNRYMASFTTFLSENRGHYMIENILEDGISDFFITHLYKYPETWTLPIHFCGSIAWHFRDKIQDLCNGFQVQTGRILQAPMDGLIEFHK